MMSEQQLKMMSCYKKDGITLDFVVSDKEELIVTLVDTSFGSIRDKFKWEKLNS